MSGRRLGMFLVASAVAIGPGRAQVEPGIAVDPSCGAGRPVELSVRFTGTMFVPGGDVLIYFDWPRDDRIVAEDELDEDRRFDTRGVVSPENPPDPGLGGYRVAAVQPRRPNDYVTTIFRVPCPPRPTTTTSTPRPPSTTTTTTEPPQVFEPVLTFNPALGPPGFATTAVGTGWPPGAVTLGWDSGGLPISTVADSSGNFAATVLVLPGMTLGEHGMVGSGAGGVGAGGDFLIVPRSMAPPLWLR